jgi:hypothetical protein
MRVPNLQGGGNEIKAVRSSSKSSLQVVSRPPASRDLKDKHKEEQIHWVVPWRSSSPHI